MRYQNKKYISIVALLLSFLIVFSSSCIGNTTINGPDEKESTSEQVDIVESSTEESDTADGSTSDELITTVDDTSVTEEDTTTLTATDTETEEETTTDYLTDPYVGVSKEEFYENYTPARSEMDAYYRSLHAFMSGSLGLVNQAPTIAEDRPTQDGLYVKNSFYGLSESGKTYTVYDKDGNEVFKVYKGGGYETLEEVAAYVFAFGDVPANYVEDRDKELIKTSIWGEHLRLNNSYFSGDVENFPYEPILPGISGCGGDYDYYEIDIGTTGTNSDPKYPPEPYVDGDTLSRGAARIVYIRYHEGQVLENLDERHVFYTYNHYNDFQEYLNYYNGWGEMFGNITGGGEISSRENYNPSDYVEVILSPLVSVKRAVLLYLSDIVKYEKAA